ncbi:hypothetical protein N9B82_06155 [Saprospiraceae bacterium]|nr:hypothetical protein [Saprospiraceae bacterium]
MKYSILFAVFLFVISCNSQVKTNKELDYNPLSRYELEKDKKVQIGQYMMDILEDSKGNMWFGTLQNGVGMYDGKTFRYYTTEDGLIGNYVSSFVEDKNGIMWFGTHAGLSKYDGENFVNFDENDGLISNDIANMLIDNSGKIWIGTWNGICTFDGQTFTNFPVPTPDVERIINHETKNWSTDLFQDSKGNIWFARDGYGACKYNGETFSHFTKKEGLLANTVRDIAEDADGNMWFGSRSPEKDLPDMVGLTLTGGLQKYDGENYSDFPEHKGLYGNDVYEIYRDSKDNMWFSTREDGIYKYDGKEFVNYQVNYPGDESSLASVKMFEDSKGNLWISCAGGLFRLNDQGVMNITIDGPWE